MWCVLGSCDELFKNIIFGGGRLLLCLISECLSLIKRGGLLVLIRPFLDFEKCAASAKQSWRSQDQDLGRAPVRPVCPPGAAASLGELWLLRVTTPWAQVGFMKREGRKTGVETLPHPQHSWELRVDLIMTKKHISFFSPQIP